MHDESTRESSQPLTQRPVEPLNKKAVLRTLPFFRLTRTRGHWPEWDSHTPVNVNTITTVLSTCAALQASFLIAQYTSVYTRTAIVSPLGIINRGVAPIRFGLLQGTLCSGNIVSTRPLAQLYCFAEAHHAVDRYFFQPSTFTGEKIVTLAVTILERFCDTILVV